MRHRYSLLREDFEDRQRYLNTCNTIHTLFQMNAIPVVNENDTISVDEIKFGDNDALSALGDEPAECGVAYYPLIR